MALMRREGPLRIFFKGWVYQSQSSSACPAQPPPPPPKRWQSQLGWGIYPRDRGGVNTWSQMGGVRMHTRGSGFKGVMGSSTSLPDCRRAETLPTCCRRSSASLSLPSLCFEGLAFPLSLFSAYSPWVAGIRFPLACGDSAGRDYVPWRTCFYVQRKACRRAWVRFYLYPAKGKPRSKTQNKGHKVKRILELLACLILCLIFSAVALGFCGFFD
jgi:hypothetical protein